MVPTWGDLEDDPVALLGELEETPTLLVALNGLACTDVGDKRTAEKVLDVLDTLGVVVNVCN